MVTSEFAIQSDSASILFLSSLTSSKGSASFNSVNLEETCAHVTPKSDGLVETIDIPSLSAPVTLEKALLNSDSDDGSPLSVQPSIPSFTIASDTGLVSYSKDDPDAQGKTLLRNLRVTNVGNRWQGQIYVKQLKAYTDADIILTSSDSMDINVKVGFMRRKVTWQRSTETPKLREE